MFSPKLFIELAQSLIKKRDYSEAGARTAISRIYYGTFLIIREEIDKILNQENTDMGSKNIWNDLKKQAWVHAIIIEILKKTDKTMGDKLFALRRNRNESDYEIDKEINWYIAEDTLIKAERLLKDFQTKLPQLSKKLENENFLVWFIKKYNPQEKNCKCKQCECINRECECQECTCKNTSN